MPDAPTVAVPAPAALSRVPNLELMHTGTWTASTGVFTCTPEDLLAAVAALECPAVRRAGVKIGHTDPRFDGEPNVGYIDNLAVAENGRTLVGDYAGLPGWLADVLPSAWPDRSVEASYDFRCQMGHVHPFVLTAVALLGVSAPGIGTLQSLQDVAALYGIAAAAPESGIPVRITVHAKEQPMPSPQPQQIAATVTTEDVRRAFYASPQGQNDLLWVEEMQVDPPQLIVINDATGQRTRVPVTVGEGDGEDAVSFGDPVPVLIQYVDKASPSGVAASTARAGALVFASKAESRPPQSPAATAGGTTEQEGTRVMTDDELSLRTELGLAAEASHADVLAAVKARGAAPQTTPDEPDQGDEDKTGESTGAPAVAASTEYSHELQRVSRELAEVKAARAADTKRTLFDRVLAAGKITPAERPNWEKRYDQAPGVITDVLASIAPGTAVPVADVGHAGAQEETSEERDYDALFGTDQKVSA